MDHRLPQTDTKLWLVDYEAPWIAPETRRWKRVWKRSFVIGGMLFSDVVLSLLVWGMAYGIQSLWGQGQLSDIAFVSVLPSVVVWVCLRALLGLYPGYGLDQIEELRRQTFAVLTTVGTIAVFATAFQIGGRLSRLQLLAGFLGLLIFAPLARSFVKRIMQRTGAWGKPVMILGSGQNQGKVREGVQELLREEWALGYNPVAVFNCHLTRESLAEGAHAHFVHDNILEAIVADAAKLAREHSVDTAIIAMPYTRREQLAQVVNRVSASFRHVLLIPNLSGITNSAVVARDLGGTFAVEIKYNLLNLWALRTKRVLDLAATIVGGFLILPFILLIALLIYVESGGGVVFYRDQRMGRDGRLFSCFKFRTMVPEAEVLLQRMLAEDERVREEYDKYHKLRLDPRVTSIGRFLRKTSLDEVPQLWNVLRGEMSLVGPRPYLPRESLEIGATQGEILRVPPGVTGPWQVAGRNHTSFGERVQMDAVYVRDWSIWLDIVLLARTVKSVLFDKAAY